MTLPFDMEVYTKRLLRSNSHNVGGAQSRESNSTSCRSIKIQPNFDMSATLTKSSICSCPESRMDQATSCIHHSLHHPTPSQSNTPASRKDNTARLGRCIHR